MCNTYIESTTAKAMSALHALNEAEAVAAFLLELCRDQSLSLALTEKGFIWWKHWIQTYSICV